MLLTEERSAERLFYLDNIRYLLVLSVVVVHAASAYSNYTPWWPVNDVNSEFFDTMLRFLDVAPMPSLFFIAGYFALPSLRAENFQTWAFIKKKLIRLGIPWLIGVTLLGPVRLVIFECTRYKHFDLWNILVTLNSNTLSFYTGVIDSTYQFNHIHFWFISLLLYFFIGFALLHKVTRRRKGPSPASHELMESPSGKSILITFLIVGLLSAFITFFIHGLFSQSEDKDPWILIGNLVQFQPTRFISYVMNFGLGVFACHKKWFNNGQAPGHFLLWLVLGVVLWIGWERALYSLYQDFSLPLAVIVVLIRPFLFYATLMALITFGLQYWQSRSKINRTLSENSYAIYLVHLFFVWIMQWLLVEVWDLPIYLKFSLVTLSSVLLSWVLSHYFVRKFAERAQ